jgi:methylated-DNA-[protein]-cysteine S-methyltransferase
MDKICIDYDSINGIDFVFGSYKNRLCLLNFRSNPSLINIQNRIKKALKSEFIFYEDTIIKQTKKELKQYFACKRVSFDIPLLLIGSAFRQQIWKTLQEIPYATTISYKQLALRVKPNAQRAAANANSANPIVIIIPCHRVIRSDGKLSGYSGGHKLKKKLLDLEFSNKPKRAC